MNPTRLELRGWSDERGAALIEFAMILPVFMAIVLGVFSGGQAYEEKISITNAVREGSRYGATLSVNNDMGAWLRAIAVTVQENATGDLKDGAENRRICVAFVHPSGTTPNDSTQSFVLTTGSIPATVTPTAGRCKLADGTDYIDGLASDKYRVNVVASRTRDFQAFFFSRTLTLQAKSVTRYEAEE